MKAADTTLYWAKADGRNRFALFDEARHRSDVDRFELSARMPDALTRGEFALEYQPWSGWPTGRPSGWRRSSAGVPGRERSTPTVRPLAEDTGLIVPLGRWVLDAGVPVRRSWAADDPAARAVDERERRGPAGA